jgi:hypothetical protein
MPRYEIAAHVVLDLDCDTPEDAAEVVRHRLLAEATGASALRHLAVWPLASDSSTWAAPADLRRRLAEFFAEVDRYAVGAEEAFRARVDDILTRDARDTAALADVVLEAPKMKDQSPDLPRSGSNGSPLPEPY